MTFNGCTTPYCTDDASFGAYCENLKEEKLMLKVVPM